MNCKLAALLAAVALGAISQAASAADLPARPVYREAAVVPVVANWTGFYVGAGGGYGTYNADTTTSGETIFGPIRNRQWTGWRARLVRHRADRRRLPMGQLGCRHLCRLRFLQHQGHDWRTVWKRACALQAELGLGCRRSYWLSRSPTASYVL